MSSVDVPATPVIAVNHLYKDYQAVERYGLLSRLLRVKRRQQAEQFALKNINLTVQAGEILVIMGLSGSGKSTLLRCLNKLITPTSGEILIEGTDICLARGRHLRRIRAHTMGMVFQHFALLPHLSAAQNVSLGLRLSGVSRKHRSTRALEALKLVGLEAYADRKVSEFSGGMQQRVGIARALVMDTPILLMDEPFSALDPLIRADMQAELLRLQKKLRKTIVFVTHDPKEAVLLGDRIAVLLDGEIVQQGPAVEVITQPASDYVGRFFSDIRPDDIKVA